MNLADTTQRRAVQSAKIGNRPGIIPERRDTRQPALEVNASMRTARRGDGGAQELLRSLGLVQRAGEDLASYVDRKHVADEQDNIAKGFADQQVGAVDEAQMEKSLGYRNAVTKGRTVNEFAKASREFDEELRGVIEQQDDPELEVRQAEISERIETFYRDFAIDPQTGEIKRSLQSPGALRYLADTMSQSRAAITANAEARIEERFNTEAVGHYHQFVDDQIDANVLPDLEAARSLLPPTVSEEQIAETTFAAFSNGVDRLRAAGRFEDAAQLLASARGFVSRPVESGTPAAQRTGTGPAKTGRVSFDALAGAVEFAESRGNADAVSPKGAVGTMQTMPATLKDPGFGVKPAQDDSAEERTRVGRDYLKAMLKRYDGDYVRALAAYNGGPGNVDDWNLSGSTRQKIAAIPFKETREYVQGIMGRLGLVDAPADAAPVEPGFRLTRPGADPVTLFEQVGNVSPIKGLDRVQFSPEQRARLNDLYERKTAELRRDWMQKREEDQAFNASELMAGALGLGAVTTHEDAVQALRSGAIAPDHFLTLARAIDAQEDRRAAEADRVEARYDREQRKQQEDRANAVAGRILSPLLAGSRNSGQTVSELMKALPALSDDPAVAQSVMSTVLSVSSGWEKVVTENAGARDAVNSLKRMGGNAGTRLANSGILPSRMTYAKRELDQAYDMAEATLAQRVLAGEDPQGAMQEVLKDIAAAEVAVVQKYGTRRVAQ